MGRAAVLDAWLKLIRPLDQETLTAPTPSRGRSLRNLTVNVFHPFELLPTAFETGRFDWDPTLDEDREAAVQNAAAVVAYASDRTWPGRTGYARTRATCSPAIRTSHRRAAT